MRTSGGSPPELGKVQRAVWLGLDRQGWVQAVGGAVIGLIALFSSYDHIHIFSRSIRLDQQWAFGSSLPRWRLFLSELCHTARHLGATLNWHRDPGYEQRMLRLRQETEQIKNDAEQIKNETEQIKSETEQIRRETEQLKHENARLRQLNARGRALLSCASQLCSLPESNSSPASSTAPD